MPAALPTAARLEIPGLSRLTLDIFFDKRALEIPSFLAKDLRFLAINLVMELLDV